MSLDPTDPRTPREQVYSALRAAILTKKYQPGDRLPPQSELTKQWGVSKQTVQNAINDLHSDGLIYTRSGTGVFVRERTERPIGLRPHIERAFEDQRVTIDFAGFSGETLHGVIQEPLDKIRVGRLAPESIRIRMLLPDTDSPMGLPCKADDLTDSPAFRKRATEIMRRHTLGIVDNINELGQLGLVKDVSAEVRVYKAAPLFKLYLLNNQEAFFGFYPVQEHVIEFGGESQAIYDLMGKDAILFQHSATDDDMSTGSQYVEQARMWFNSMWDTVGQEYAR